VGVHTPLVLASLLIAVAGCGPPIPDSGSGATSPAVSFEPSAELSAVPNVVHVHVASGSLGAGEVSLFQGSLSDYYLSKVKHGDVPDTLLTRQVPLISWRTESELVLAPLVPLEAGPYSLAASSGLLSEFQVSPGLPLLRRVWPPAGAGGSPRLAVYCADSAAAPGPGALLLEPGDVSVALSAGVDDASSFAQHCVHFSAENELDSGQIVVPAPVFGAWAPDPSPFSAPADEAALPISCNDGELTLGLGCAIAADDRAVVRTPAASLLWIVHTVHGGFVEVTHGGASFVVRGLAPASHERLWGSVHDATGAESSFDLVVDTAAARARPVLNEVLADALGPEPQSEWIELVNDGSLALDLSGYSLQDSGGLTALPAQVLGPEEYALLVRNDFAPDASDVPPAPGARLIRMPALGKSGLSNAGERLALLDAAGLECSALPALPAKPGQSLARLHLWSLDNDPGAFSFGTPTPGVANDAPK
jgi:hypothetical protein